MSAVDTLHQRPLFLAVAAGVLAGAAIYSAAVTPWLALLVHEPGELDWLNGSNGAERFLAVFQSSLLAAAIYSPLLVALAALAERKAWRSFPKWLLLGMVGASPLVLLSLFVANDRLDCFTNCEPSPMRNLVAAGSVVAAIAAGTLVVWRVRRGAGA